MDFASTLMTLRRKSGPTCYKLSQWSGLSEPYIYRLESRERTEPSRDVVIVVGYGSGPQRICIGDMGRR